MSIHLDGDVCVLCGLCVGVCPPGALRLLPQELEVSPRCNECGLCVPYCPVGALSGGRYRPQRLRT